jgi:hypothetical protein
MNDIFQAYWEDDEGITLEEAIEKEEERREMAYDAWREEQLCNN